MGSRGIIFDLNEPAAEDDETGNVSSQPQISPLPSTSQTSASVNSSIAAQATKDNLAFSHQSSMSGFQPFVRPKVTNDEVVLEQNTALDRISKFEPPLNLNNGYGRKTQPQLASGSTTFQPTEREEGEWVDTDGSAGSSQHLDSNGNLDASSCPEAKVVASRQREVKGSEASHALRLANLPAKRKIDHQKEAMLGKMRNRQTMLINIDEVKQAETVKSLTPKRQLTSARTKESKTLPLAAGEKYNHSILKDQKQVELPSSEAGTSLEFSQAKSESNGEINSSQVDKFRRLNGDADSLDTQLPPVTRQSSWKQPIDMRHQKNFQMSNRRPPSNNQNPLDQKPGGKKSVHLKKTVLTGSSYHDTSVERLIREVTNEKFWHHPEDSELQCVPGQFESSGDYVSVFEPLLFEECRAQLYSTWEELSETNSHIMVRVKNVERRERGWYDVIVLSVNDCKWNFKEGDVAVLSNPKPGTVRSKRNLGSTSEDGDEPDKLDRVAGTVRRHIPLDNRDPPGAILHFYVGDSYDPYGKVDDDHILRKLQHRSTWYLTVLGSLATTQREYVALHAFCRLNSQMQHAILKPSREQFPNYEQQTPTMPDCFTPNFTDHLHRSFNDPQLSAIQWAAMHTAAGTSSGVTKRQDPWPFTLVQGPPGTGKTHTVWGMLNVIHLVQYQHYYTSLLKKLAPQSYKVANENNSESIVVGSIDEVLHNMDQNLFRSLSKLCPKPRMLVCAPSNAATDELLSRVLDRGFIDGEMKVYRPDVARVGVDSQSRAAQAVSVERRTEQLLVKSREEVSKWMQDLRGQVAYFSAHIADLQNKLSFAAADGHSQGSVGVDPDVLMARDQNRDALLQNLAAAVENRDKVLVEISRLLILESRFRNNGNFNLEEARASLEASFANEAEIVFTTVSSSGRKLFSRLTHGFDMVVIDEAAQASEVGVLPPLALGAARCVLVGDPQQLPATVISKAAGTLLYSRSLFERFQQAGCPTMLLSVQYRMHPQIRDFPSRYFYQGRLTDSESVTKLPDEVYYKDPLLRPYLFYDVTHGRESHRGGSVSYQNIHEAQLCVQLYEHLLKTVKSLGIGRITVGIITPYKLQLKCLQQEFSEILKSEEGKDIYINTVDAFQGQERDVIIMSCVQGSLQRSKKVDEVWKKAVAHFVLCFVMGFFTGFTPTDRSSIPVTTTTTTRPTPTTARSDISSNSLSTSLHFSPNKIASLNSASTKPNTTRKLASKADPVSNSTAAGEPKPEDSAGPKERLIIIITPANGRDWYQMVYLRRLAHTLRLVPPPLMWVVVEKARPTKSEMKELPEMLRMTKVMYRHILYWDHFTDEEAELEHQRNLGLKLLEYHRLNGIVHFAGIHDVYDLHFFKELRQIHKLGRWPAALVRGGDEVVIQQGPNCDSSKLTRWHLNHTKTLVHFNLAFNTSILWAHPSSSSSSSSQHTSQLMTLVKEVAVQGDTKLRGVLQEDCSKIMVWHLRLYS